MAGVDDLVTTVISSLKELDLLDDTYIIYTSDNGYHIGQHRLSPGKSCGIEEDINVPFFIRGPGIPANVIVDYPTSHTDLVPTIFSLAGIPLHDDFDGVPMPLPYPSSSVNSSNRTEHINIEFWGTQIQEGLAASPFILPNNTYNGLRIVSPDNYDLAYFVWCTNEHELYNMQSDQWQMNNLYDQAGQVNGWDIGKLQTRLDALMMVLKSCKGQSCRDPWGVLHPDGSVTCLQQAMNSTFDDFYQAQPSVSFEECALGYIVDVEGPQDANLYQASGSKTERGYEYMKGSHWSEWT